MEGDSMFTAEQFRTKVGESAETIKNTDVPSEIRKIERSMESYSLSAQNEDWLADNFDKMLRSQVVLSEDEALGERLDSKAVAKIEEHAAVPRGRCHHAVEYDPKEAATRAF